MNLSVCIASLRFSPAHISHMVAYGKALGALGYEVEYVLDPRYMRFAEFAGNPSAIASTKPNWDSGSGYAHAIFYSPAPANHLCAARLRATGCKVWYVYHEPAEPLRTYLRTESPWNVVKLLLAHHLSTKMLERADEVVLSSERAVETYQQRDIRHNPKYCRIPLLLDDESAPFVGEERRYFSYIGNITKAHGFDDFIRFIRFARAKELNIRFLIASRRPLPSELAHDAAIACSPERVMLQCGRPLSNDEINRRYAQSICVWNVYRRSTQSGVLAKATMMGAPVLVSGAGSFREFVSDGCEGRLLRSSAPADVFDGYEEIASHLDEYVKHARERFQSTFYWKAQLAKFSETFGSAVRTEESVCS